MPSSASSANHRRLHSFPTRRSSDLARRRDSPPLDSRLCCPAGAPECRSRPRPSLDRKGWPDYRCTACACPTTTPPSGFPGRPDSACRSEEHTSELQSRLHLVCRLLLPPPTTDVYTLSLHDALPILRGGATRHLSTHVFAAQQVPQNAVPVRDRRWIGKAGRIIDVLRVLARRQRRHQAFQAALTLHVDRKSTRLNSSHGYISYAVFCFLRQPPTSTLFPYTTLFRSCAEARLATSRLTSLLPSRCPRMPFPSATVVGSERLAGLSMYCVCLPDDNAAIRLSRPP